MSWQLTKGDTMPEADNDQVAAPTGVATVLFCDLVSSTERTVRLGEEAGDAFRRRFMGALRATVQRHHGRELKHLGDGLMVIFEGRALDAIACALDLHDAASSVDPEDPPLLRVGMSAGELSLEADDVFGLPVVEAARLCAAAQPQQTLASDVVVALVGTRGSFALDPVGPMVLKGLPDAVKVHQLRRALATDHHRTRHEMVVTATSSSPRRRRGLVIGGAVLTIALLAGAVWLSRRSLDSSTSSPEIPADAGSTTSVPVPAVTIPTTRTTISVSVGPGQETWRGTFEGEVGSYANLYWGSTIGNVSVNLTVEAPNGLVVASEAAITGKYSFFKLPESGTYRVTVSFPAPGAGDLELELLPA